MPPVEEANKPRYSIAFFAQPNKNSLVQGLKHKYPPITAGEYVLQVGLPPGPSRMCLLASSQH